MTEIWQPPKDQPPHPGWWKASDGRWYPPRTPPTPAAPSVIYVEKAASNGLAVAALVLGIIGVVVGLIPLFFFIALPLGVLAFVFGLIGRSRRRQVHRGMGIAGLVLGVIAVVLGIVGARIVTDATDHLKDCLNTVSSDLQNGTHNADNVCGK